MLSTPELGSPRLSGLSEVKPPDKRLLMEAFKQVCQEGLLVSSPGGTTGSTIYPVRGLGKHVHVEPKQSEVSLRVGSSSQSMSQALLNSPCEDGFMELGGQLSLVRR